LQKKLRSASSEVPVLPLGAENSSYATGSDNNFWTKWPIDLGPLSVKYEGQGHRSKLSHVMINATLSAVDACYKLTYFCLFVKLFLLMLSVWPCHIWCNHIKIIGDTKGGHTAGGASYW